ncbi:MAG: LysR substrate-binding domain-containing protein [Rhizorhabdus sp.]
MEIRQLRYFVAVAEELSFSRAALRLNVSQPPISVQVKALETDLGVTLLNRDRRSVELTEAGELFLDHARRVLMEVDAARLAARRAAKGEVGLVRVGYTGSVPMLEMFTDLIRAFRTEQPGVRLELRHMSTNAQLRAIAAMELDVGFLRPCADFTPVPPLRLTPIWRDELMAFFPSDHVLAAATGPVDLQALAPHDMVWIAGNVGCGIHDQIGALWRDAGLVPHVAQEARELRTVLSLVAAGVGFTILPSCFRNGGVINVKDRPLAGANIQSKLMLAHRSHKLAPSIRRFVIHAEAAAAHWTKSVEPSHLLQVAA